MSDGQITTPVPVPGGCQSVTTSGTSARTETGVGAYTKFVNIEAVGAALHYRFGDASVVATTADTYLAADSSHFVRISPSQYVAAIQSTAAGTMKVSEFQK